VKISHLAHMNHAEKRVTSLSSSQQFTKFTFGGFDLTWSISGKTGLKKI